MLKWILMWIAAASVVVAIGCNESALSPMRDGGAAGRLDAIGAVDAAPPCATRSGIETNEDRVFISTVDDQYVYWMGSRRALRAADRCNGVPFTVAEQPDNYSDFVSDNDRLYYVTNSGSFPLVAIPRRGGPPERLTTGINVASGVLIAIGDGRLYWGDGNQFRTFRLRGATTSDFLGPPGYLPNGIERRLLVDEQTLFWYDEGGEFARGAIMAMPRGGGAPRVVTAGETYIGGVPAFMEMDGQNLYFIGWHNTLEVVPKSGGASHVLVGDGRPCCVAITNRYVYWFNVDPVQTAQNGLYRMAKSGRGDRELLTKRTDGGLPVSDGTGVWVPIGQMIHYYPD